MGRFGTFFGFVWIIIIVKRAGKLWLVLSSSFHFLLFIFGARCNRIKQKAKKQNDYFEGFKVGRSSGLESFVDGFLT